LRNDRRLADGRIADRNDAEQRRIELEPVHCLRQ
jgi:hypothetical protein